MTVSALRTPLRAAATAASIGASLLNATADALRALADAGTSSAASPAAAPEAAAPPTTAAARAKPPVDRHHGETPPAATRSRIANPKAARKARQRRAT